jgi:hypothetical protein
VKAFADQPNLVLDLALLPLRSWRAGGRFDQVMTAHPQKAAIEPPVLADEHGLDAFTSAIVSSATFLCSSLV